MKKLLFGLTVFLSLTALASDPSLPKSDPSGSEKGTPSVIQISRGKYITGGVLASTLGFGIGHAVQGRYSEKGWIFTAAEVTGLALLIHANCFRPRNTNSQIRSVREQSDCENVTEGIGGAALLLGFHIWEVIDAWTQAQPLPNSSEVFVLPVEDGVNVSLNLRF